MTLTADYADETVAGSSFFQQAMAVLDDLRAEALNHPRLTKDEHAIVVAMAHALRADCTRRRVGAVGVDTRGRFIGAGRNGAAPSRPGCLSAGACPRGRLSYEAVAPGSSYATGQSGACIALHAEENLSLFTSPDARHGATAGVTDAPCDNCSKVLAGAGWARAIWPELTDGIWSVRVRNIDLAPIGGLYG